jgi:hypothetical protein
MPTLTIEGKSVQVDDSFLKLSPDEQNKTVDEIAASIGVQGKNASRETSAPADQPISADNLARSAVHGIPLVGGVADKFAAGMDALTAPVFGRGSQAPTIGERYAENAAREAAKTKGFEEAHPIADVAAKVGGGVASLGGVMMRVPGAAAALGAEGTVPQMVAKGAVSGGALSATDAAIRGDDPLHAAEEGAVLGAAGGPVGKAIGAGVRKVAGAFKPAPALEHAVTTDVAGVPVPVPTSDPAIASKIEIARRGGAGEPAQRVVQTGDEATQAALDRANANIGSGLDPSGAPAVPAQGAAEAVAAELRAAEQQRFQTEQNTMQRAVAGTEALRADIGRVDPALPAAIHADSPGTAAERIGTGVNQRAGAARAAFKADYDAVKAMESEFAPGAFKPVAETVRGRLSAGENPVTVDTVTTPHAANALKDLETNVGLGNFENLAEPKVPTAAAGAPASASDQVAAELAKMGVKPGATFQVGGERGAVPGGTPAPSPASSPANVLAPHEVAVPGGKSVAVAPKVVEARSIRTSADAGYDPALQPRNRARAASDEQVRDISSNLNPSRLGVSSEADRGAPIIGADGMVESGNGRVLALRQAYGEGGAAAQRYREWLAGQGVDVSKYKEPVLVRERTTPMSPAERKAFTVAANQSSTLSLSATERALADARLITPDSLSLIKNPGDLGAVENRDFVRSLMARIPQAERGALMTADGDLSAEGLARVRNAVLGKAYGESPVLTRIAESTHDDVKSISNALTAAAPEWAMLKAEIAAGRVPAELDATKDLLDAVARTARIRAKGVGLADARAQADAFSTQSPESMAFQRMFYGADGEKAASASQVAAGVRNYAQEAMKVDAAPGLGLGLAPVTARDILESTARKIGAPAELAKSVAEAAQATAGAAEAAPGKKVDMNSVDAARKRLVTFYQDAKDAAPRGESADTRATRRILHEFDQYVLDTVDSPAYRGDPAALETLKRARAGVAEYHKQFSPQGRGDEVGKAVEKILGRFPGQHATPDQIAAMSYGPVGEPGGAQAVKVSQRLRTILGPTSPEWGAYKQGLLSHLVDMPPGGAARTGAETADRIDRFLNGTKGKPLAQAVLSADERAALARHADVLRASDPVPLSSLDTVDKVIARISGRDGGLPASTTEVVDYLYGRNGAGDKGISVRLAQTLKRQLSPEAFTQLRQGMWSKLTGEVEGKTQFGAQKLSQRLHEFLNGTGAPLSHVLYTPAERAEMVKFAAAVKMHAPLPGTTNPSGTAPMLAKMVGKASHLALPLIGAAHGGIVGAIGGVAVDRALTSATNARAARQIGRLYYGPQTSAASGPVDPRFAKAGMLAFGGAKQGQISQR